MCNTKNIRIYGNKNIKEAICHSLESKNTYSEMKFLCFCVSETYRKIFLICCTEQMCTKHDFYLLGRNMCCYVQVAFFFYFYMNKIYAKYTYVYSTTVNLRADGLKCVSTETWIVKTP
jgi:hypothetical protein